MAFLALLLSAIIARVSWQRYPADRITPVQKKFWEQTCVVTSSLALVLLFYGALLTVLAFGWQWITVHDLERLETGLTNLKAWTDAHRPSWLTWLFWSVILYLTSAIWIRFLTRELPFAFTKKLKLGLQIITTTIFFLATFTLLGFQAGPPAATLSLHLQKIRTEHGLMQAELADALAGATLNQVYAKATDALPQHERTRAVLDDAARTRERLQERLQRVRPGDRTTRDALQHALRQLDARERPYEVRPRPVPTVSPDEHFWFVPLPDDTTYEKTRTARERVREFAERVRPSVIRLLQRPGGKDVVLELPKGAIDDIAKVLDPLAHDYPLLKPALEVTKNMVNDVLKNYLKGKLERLVADAAEHPAALDASLPAAIREAVDTAKPDVSPSIERSYNREVASERHDITDAQRTIARMDAPHPAPRPRPIERAAAPPHTEPREARRSFEPPRTFSPREREPFGESPRDATPPGGGGGGGGGGSTRYTYTTSCVCNHYINGALVSSVPIPVGARCGVQVCGRDMPAH